MLKSGNAAPYAPYKWRQVAGVVGRRKTPVTTAFVQKVAEGKTSYEFSWKVNVHGTKIKKRSSG